MTSLFNFYGQGQVNIWVPIFPDKRLDGNRYKVFFLSQEDAELAKDETGKCVSISLPFNRLNHTYIQVYACYYEFSQGGSKQSVKFIEISDDQALITPKSDSQFSKYRFIYYRLSMPHALYEENRTN